MKQTNYPAKAYITLGGIALSLIICFSFTLPRKPTLYIIGDSTVAPNNITDPIQGWGNLLGNLFDTTRIAIQNRAVAGISSRTFYTGLAHSQAMRKNGMWDSIRKTLQPGDYVLMQFGHNDDSPVADTTRNRGSIHGVGVDSAFVINPYSKKSEQVYSYGWYIAKFIQEAKQRGAIPIVCSPIPMNKWNGALVKRVSNTYGKWAGDASTANNAFFIDLNKLVAEKYDAEGSDNVGKKYFVADNVHTTLAGAKLNAASIAGAVKQLNNCTLKSYLR